MVCFPETKYYRNLFRPTHRHSLQFHCIYVSRECIDPNCTETVLMHKHFHLKSIFKKNSVSLEVLLVYKTHHSEFRQFHHGIHVFGYLNQIKTSLLNEAWQQKAALTFEFIVNTLKVGFATKLVCLTLTIDLIASIGTIKMPITPEFIADARQVLALKFYI